MPAKGVFDLSIAFCACALMGVSDMGKEAMAGVMLVTRKHAVWDEYAFVLKKCIQYGKMNGHLSAIQTREKKHNDAYDQALKVQRLCQLFNIRHIVNDFVDIGCGVRWGAFRARGRFAYAGKSAFRCG